MIKAHQIPKSCLSLFFYVICLHLVCLRMSCLFSLSFVWNTNRRGRGWVCFIHCWASMPWHMMTFLCNQKREEYLLKERMVVSKTISLRCLFSELTWIWENWLPRLFAKSCKNFPKTHWRSGKKRRNTVFLGLLVWLVVAGAVAQCLGNS